MKKKIAFVVIRYGKDINGGAEYHCRMLAERLATDYAVEVLTTCVCNYHTGANELPAGTSVVNGVMVRRFPVAPVAHERHAGYLRQLKAARKWRRTLFRLHLLRAVAAFCPVWTYKNEAESAAFRSSLFHSPGLVAHVQCHQADYHAFIPVNMVESPCFFTACVVPEKTILIPCLHNAGTFFWVSQTWVMTRVAHIAFNTTAEQRLAGQMFGCKMSRHSVVGVGIEEPRAADWAATQQKYGLPEDYLLYMGRMDAGKLQHIFEYFLAYKQAHSSRLKFVLVGNLPLGRRPFDHSDVLFTGFVSDEEKRAILQHARVVVNPSRFESLSLILLETLNEGKPMLVNARCEVLREHVKKSGGAVLSYRTKYGFVRCLHKVCSSESLCREMGEKGRRYVGEHYAWPKVLERMKGVIETIKV